MTTKVNRSEALAARARWEQAIKDGRDHGTVNAFWESYVRLAGREFSQIERESKETK